MKGNGDAARTRRSRQVEELLREIDYAPKSTTELAISTPLAQPRRLIPELSRAGWMIDVDGRWELTDEGRAALMRLQRGHAPTGPSGRPLAPRDDDDDLTIVGPL